MNAYEPILSKVNASGFWGVAPAKTGFTVRFRDKASKEIVTFKAKTVLSDKVAAALASRFYRHTDLYSTMTEEVWYVDGNAFRVNACTNTISQKDISVQSNQPPANPQVVVKETKPKVEKVAKFKKPSSNDDSWETKLRQIKEGIKSVDAMLKKLSKKLAEAA